MSNGSFSLVGARTAAEVCECFDIGDEARALLRPDLSPRQYVDLLAEKQSFPPAIRFLAHALPKKEAVLWACSCVRETAGAKPLPAATAALEAAERWVRSPTEDNRRAAMPAAQAAGLATAAGSAALAAFVSGGSLGPPNVPPVPPPENMTGQVAGGAVLLAAIESEPEKAIERFRAFLSRGIEVASGSAPAAVKK
jgi:Family of unknown function (DUF6931)